MQTSDVPDVGAWPIARFPSGGQREEFLGQVRLWNKVEGLPRIETAPLGDGVRLRFWSHDPRQANILRLIDAFGGFVGSRFPVLHALSGA